MQANRKYYVFRRQLKDSQHATAVEQLTPNEQQLARNLNVRTATIARRKKEIIKLLTLEQHSFLLELNKENKETDVNQARRNLLQIPYLDPQSRSFKAFYIRYADDWVFFLRGDLSLANEIKEIISSEFNKLKLTLSAEKTKITNIRNEKCCFLGFEIFYQRNCLIKKIKTKILVEHTRRITTLQVHPDTARLKKRFTLRGFIDKRLMPREIGFLTVLSDH